MEFFADEKKARRILKEKLSEVSGKSPRKVYLRMRCVDDRR
jgi:hypothetical protein